MGRKLIDRTGQTFNRLTVLETFRLASVTRVRCRCSCGAVVDILMSCVVQGSIKSCGCLRREYRRAQWLKHDEASDYRSGRNGTAEYRAWVGMNQRCYRPDVAHRRIYTDRGITVCDRWRHDFAAFLSDVGRKPSPDLSLDRIDNDGNYEPGNVRWATRSEQAKNRRPRPRDANNQNWLPGPL